MFKSKLKELRERKGERVADMALRCGVCISTLYKLEAREQQRYVDGKVALQLMRYFGLSELSEIFELEK